MLQSICTCSLHACVPVGLVSPAAASWEKRTVSCCAPKSFASRKSFKTTYVLQRCQTAPAFLTVFQALVDPCSQFGQNCQQLGRAINVYRCLDLNRQEYKS